MKVAPFSNTVSNPDRPGVCLFLGAPKGHVPDDEIDLWCVTRYKTKLARARAWQAADTGLAREQHCWHHWRDRQGRAGHRSGSGDVTERRGAGADAEWGRGARGPLPRRGARDAGAPERRPRTFVLKTGWNSFRAGSSLICTEARSASLPSANTSKRASRASPATTREGSRVATSSRKRPMVWSGQNTVISHCSEVGFQRTGFKWGSNLCVMFYIQMSGKKLKLWKD